MKWFLNLFFILSLSCLIGDNNRFFWDDWSTHQPVLYAVANSTTGPIIEFGCGVGSTDLLHEICEREGRILITLEDDIDWLNSFADKYQGSSWHQFYYVPGKDVNDPENPAHWVQFMDTFDPLEEMFFDVCFIDQSPWLARYETLKRIKDKACFVVLHDADYFAMNGIFGKVIKPIMNRNAGEFDFSDIFSTFHLYFPNQPWPAESGPPTLLGSNFEDVFPTVDYSKNIIIDPIAEN
jgi:hypothetical protein